MFYANVEALAERYPNLTCTIKYDCDNRVKSTIDFIGTTEEACSWLKSKGYNPALIECTDVLSLDEGNPIYYIVRKHTFKEKFDNVWHAYDIGLLTESEFDSKCATLLMQMMRDNKRPSDFIY